MSNLKYLNNKKTPEGNVDFKLWSFANNESFYIGQWEDDNEPGVRGRVICTCKLEYQAPEENLATVGNEL